MASQNSASQIDGFTKPRAPRAGLNKYIALEQINRVSECRWLHKKSFWVERINRSEMLGCKDGFAKMLGCEKSFWVEQINRSEGRWLHKNRLHNK